MSEKFYRKSLVPTQIKWIEEGTMVQGILVDREDTVYQGNTRGRYLVDTSEGMRVFMGGFVLDQALRPVKLGTVIGVEYLGEEKEGRGKNRLKLFDVWAQMEDDVFRTQMDTQPPEEKPPTPKK